MSFQTAGAKIVEGVSAGLYQAGVAVMVAADVLVPVETATLKRSGRVEEPVIEGDSIVATVGFGYGEALNPQTHEPAAGYAKWVELREDTRHKPPTQAHFLGDSARAIGPHVGEFIKAAVDERLHS